MAAWVPSAVASPITAATRRPPYRWAAVPALHQPDEPLTQAIPVPPALNQLSVRLPADVVFKRDRCPDRHVDLRNCVMAARAVPGSLPAGCRCGPDRDALQILLVPAFERLVDGFPGQEAWQEFGQAAGVEAFAAAGDLGHAPPAGGDVVLGFLKCAPDVGDRRLVARRRRSRAGGAAGRGSARWNRAARPAG
jgi:hypothetical protein